ncbi:T9SS C-terminal target domain-containing protein [Ornithobacterium rhinotracheale]|uniref:T9SS type A sorting domain-containing protein n=1 Tax=Ornithobacterium rhinotracheale TaxID=28251 RepID=UPI00129C1D07|nr:T9SS type A sorting domain-containing protein [Ornithobacterium rhinotracheale]MRI62583.1 T9SS C-terminal target domain-containing protein [Ornithobacterium rhinotracheale]
MKKHLFLIASVFAAFTANAQSPTLTVTSNTNVKVQNGALLYVGGKAKVENYTDTTKKVSNDGKIKITNGLTNGNSTDGKNFVNEFPATGQYGQLIVLNEGTNTGSISSGVKFGKSYVFYPLALPYKNITAGDVVKQIWGIDGSSAFVAFQAGRNPKFPNFDPKRYQNPLFFWNNDTYTLDQLASGDEIGKSGTEARYYAVSDYSSLNGARMDKISLSGTPINKAFDVTLNPYHVSDNFAENKWGEVYGSYISDFTMDKPTQWDKYGLNDVKYENTGNFGDNIFFLGNPYTSNIDLKELINQSSAQSSIVALIQFTNVNDVNNYNVGVNNGTASNAYGKNMNGATGQGGGDANLFVVRPFQTFAVKTNASVTLKFNDDIKKFDIAKAETPNNMFAKAGNDDFSLVQVGISLFTKDGQETGQKTYVAASDIYAKRNEIVTELHNIALKDDNTGIYTEQDQEEVATRGGGKLYVNGINADTYVGKPVKLVMQNANGAYIFKANLNKEAKESANKFFFEDKKTGKVIKIGEDFAYGFTSNGTEKDRFAIYWAAAPKANSVAESAKEATNTTTVFRVGNDFKVKFDKGIRKADVYVYNISGQLVSSAKAVDASTDYVVPVQGNATVYIVKVVGDNGSVVTKKIIK